MGSNEKSVRITKKHGPFAVDVLVSETTFGAVGGVVTIDIVVLTLFPVEHHGLEAIWKERKEKETQGEIEKSREKQLSATEKAKDLRRNFTAQPRPCIDQGKHS